MCRTRVLVATWPRTAPRRKHPYVTRTQEGQSCMHQTILLRMSRVLHALLFYIFHHVIVFYIFESV